LLTVNCFYPGTVAMETRVLIHILQWLSMKPTTKKTQTCWNGWKSVKWMNGSYKRYVVSL